ncbi:hypothetical protein DFJ74DRAFT_92183 [Hyaloraphidium curvatum]|nr:hypothetical protein DFJ74DRAFT_92183 [Hyaloraphidium curvatum]
MPFPASFPAYSAEYPAPFPAGPFLETLPAVLSHPTFLWSLAASIAFYTAFFAAGRLWFLRGQSEGYERTVDFERQSSWLLTLASCTTMTAAGLLALVGFVLYRYDFERYPVFGSTDLSFHLVVLFQAYLLLDLSFGVIFYRSQMTVLNGYVHHCIYSFVALYAVATRLPTVFILFWFEELPMVLLAVGAMNPKVRVNKRYGSSYFVTRILWHAWLTADLFRENRTIGAIAAAILPLNAYWMYTWVRQQVRKRRARAAAAAAAEKAAKEGKAVAGDADATLAQTKLQKVRAGLTKVWRAVRRRNRPANSEHDGGRWSF